MKLPSVSSVGVERALGLGYDDLINDRIGDWALLGEEDGLYAAVLGLGRSYTEAFWKRRRNEMGWAF